MKKTFKFLSLILAVVMLVCIIPISSSAAKVKTVNLSYHFKVTNSIKYITSYYSYSINTKWYSIYSWQYQTPLYAKNGETYIAVALVSPNNDNYFAENTDVIFNGVTLTQSDTLEENTFRFVNDNKDIELKVCFNQLTSGVNEPYSQDIEKAVNRNDGFYIKDEVIELNSLNNTDPAYHFDYWNSTGSAVIDSPEVYNSKLTMGDSESEIVANYSKHNIKKVKTVLSTKTSNGYFKYACECGYNYNLVIPKRPNVKVINGTASIKLSWSKINLATRYDVFQFNTKTKKYTKIGTTTATSFLIKGKKPATSYYYLVRAYNGNIGSSFDSKDVVKAVTLCSAPKAKVSVWGKTVTLKWAKVAGAKYYVICKYNAKTKKYTGLKKLTDTSVKLRKQPKGTNYYLVRAFNANKAGSAYTSKNLVKAVVRK